ncbi:MAG: esterase family protein [Muribaculaceae bacterium]|nr:esterase family protein [Muribaculaceae bacterium]
MRHIICIISMLLAAVGVRAAVVDTLSVPATFIPGPMRVTVVTPDEAAAGKRFPVVYILHGYDGDYRTWTGITRPDLPALADRFGMVFVMPDGRDSWYWDSPERPEMQMESFITRELVPYIDATLPTLATREKRAITGLSMGGHGALYLAMRHPDLFGNAGSMSGGVDIRPFPKSWKMAQWLGPRDADPARWDAHTVAGLVGQLQPDALNITFDCGVDDFFAGVNRELHESMLKAGIPHDYAERPGKHSHKYWANSILYHLLFFSEAFAK